MESSDLKKFARWDEEGIRLSKKGSEVKIFVRKTKSRNSREKLNELYLICAALGCED